MGGSGNSGNSPAFSGSGLVVYFSDKCCWPNIFLTKRHQNTNHFHMMNSRFFLQPYKFHSLPPYTKTHISPSYISYFTHTHTRAQEYCLDGRVSVCDVCLYAFFPFVSSTLICTQGHMGYSHVSAGRKSPECIPDEEKEDHDHNERGEI